MADPISDSELARLFYTREWLEHGFVTADQVRQQLLEAEFDVEWNLDQYRGAAFSDWMDARQCVSDEEFLGILWLFDADPDLGGLIVNGLLSDRTTVLLSEAQVDLLAARIGAAWSTTVSRWRVRQRIRSQPWSSECLELFLTVLPGWEQSELLMELMVRQTLDQHDLQEIAERGRSKRVRHEASMIIRRQMR